MRIKSLSRTNSSQGVFSFVAMISSKMFSAVAFLGATLFLSTAAISVLNRGAGYPICECPKSITDKEDSRFDLVDDFDVDLLGGYLTC